MKTLDQRMAKAAFTRVETAASEQNSRIEYRSFALSFPSLIHSCGLVQAVAFAEVKNSNYLNDLTTVLNSVETDLGTDLAARSRGADAMDYMRLSRRALSAASWLKRYAQALIKTGATIDAQLP